MKHGIAFNAGQRILDFGYSGGRVLRWFEEEAYKGVECWGCDIDAAAVDWAQKNMMPPFKFFANSTAPHLPFRDGFFDLIFAGSIFTHIKDMATSWLLELARCMKKDGVGIFTIVDEGSLEMLRNNSIKWGTTPQEWQNISSKTVSPNRLCTVKVLSHVSPLPGGWVPSIHAIILSGGRDSPSRCLKYETG